MAEGSVTMSRYLELQAELMRQTEEKYKWAAIARLFYKRHENRRSCSLLASCKECDAYERAVADED